MRTGSRGRSLVRQFHPNTTTTEHLVLMGVVVFGCCCMLSCNRLPKVIIPKQLSNPEYVLDKNGFRDNYSFSIDRKKVIQFNTLGGLRFILSDTPPHKIDNMIKNNPDWEFIFVVSMPLTDSSKLQSVLVHHNCEFPVIIDTDNVFAKQNRLGKLTAVGWISDENDNVYGNGCVGSEKSFFDQEFSRVKRRLNKE